MAARERTAASVCPRCAKHQRVAVEAVGHECERCLWEWRFAICGTCDAAVNVLEYLESWQCQSCSTFNRSWWKTADNGREAAVVAARRRSDHASHRGRWIAAGVAAVALLLAATWFLAPRESPEERERAAATSACRHFDQLRRDENSGTLTRVELLGDLESMAADATLATAPVRNAATRLVGEAQAGTDSPAFDAAMTSLTDACGVSLPDG